MKGIKSMLIGAATTAVAALAVTFHARAAEPISAPTATTAVDAAATSEHVLNRADLSAWLDGFLPYALKSGDIAGAVVAIVKNGNVLVQSGYGYANVTQHIRMDPENTGIRIGSTSKLFTWTAVMQLVGQGKLDLNRNVDDYLDFKVSPPSGRP
jgi:CubicO group peptidase (beta-lactamase class C family)